MRISQRDLLTLALLAALIWLAAGALTAPTASSHGDEPEIQTGRMSPAVVGERLVAFEGFSEVRRIELVGDSYEVEAVKHGQLLNLTVNSLTGADNISALFMPVIAR